MAEELYNSDAECDSFCDSIEKQYEQSKENSLFEILKLLPMDKDNSNSGLVEAVNYFKQKDGLIEKDAPINFLTDREKRAINKNGKFRSNLYSMLLLTKFSEGIENR